MRAALPLARQLLAAVEHGDAQRLEALAATSELRAALAAKEAENETLRTENAQLKGLVKSLRDTATMLRRANATYRSAAGQASPASPAAPAAPPPAAEPAEPAAEDSPAVPAVPSQTDVPVRRRRRSSAAVLESSARKRARGIREALSAAKQRRAQAQAPPPPPPPEDPPSSPEVAPLPPPPPPVRSPVRSPERAPESEAGHDRPDYAHVEVVRDKGKRANMRAYDCEECRAFYEAAGMDPDAMKELCSRHRANYRPYETPEGFWDLSFADEK